MEIAGDSPSMESTSGFSICSRNCRAYADSDSTYLRCPSAKIVSNARDDFPEPDTPVITTNLLRGTTTSMFLRLCSRAPRMTIESMAGRIVTAGGVGVFHFYNWWSRPRYDYRLARAPTSTCETRLSTTPQSMFPRKASMYFGRSAGL